MADVIYKICDAGIWRRAEATGRFDGSGIDLTDGYIHFSTAGQVRETASKHYHEVENLVLVAIPAERLGTALKWEVSRGGELFPHLYEPLETALALWTAALPLIADGEHRFPDQMT